ncbi:unnamed protein product [Notodromas monacha]|uniref:C2H2-type domain-containing protein n=1 Tax=Notodromas monacha TaxID=399045 RepID=A0A7R9BLV6_9CRUS|nr:unnamed protein product [Notodromas monacha]CAG0917061.1 unnamed protein product [Notodromas monacha]
METSSYSGYINLYYNLVHQSTSHYFKEYCRQQLSGPSGPGGAPGTNGPPGPRPPGVRFNSPANSNKVNLNIKQIGNEGRRNEINSNHRRDDHGGNESHMLSVDSNSGVADIIPHPFMKGFSGMMHGHPMMGGMNHGEKPYTCPFCERCFRQKTILDQHLRTHTGIKPYHCPECGKQFRQKAILNQHFRIHLGAKPYCCYLCRKSFAQRAVLDQHLKTHLNDSMARMGMRFPMTPRGDDEIEIVDGNAGHPSMYTSAIPALSAPPNHPHAQLAPGPRNDDVRSRQQMSPGSGGDRSAYQHGPPPQQYYGQGVVDHQQSMQSMQQSQRQ